MDTFSPGNPFLSRAKSRYILPVNIPKKHPLVARIRERETDRQTEGQRQRKRKRET